MSERDAPTGTKLLPAHCARVVAELEAAIAVFKRWDFPAEKKGPLPLALRRLREIVTRDTYGTTDVDLRSAGAAVSIAFDFINIVRSLPPEPNVVLARELVRMFDGTLDLREYHGAHDLRAQFAFGAVLINAGYPLSVVQTKDDATPDFVCSFANKDVGLEVKRPSNEKQILKRLDKAAAQLRTLGLPGFVVLDASRLYSAFQASASPWEGTMSLRAIVHANVSRHAMMLMQYCEAQVRNPIKRDKFAYVLGVICLVKIPFWLEHDLSAPALIHPHAEGPVMWFGTRPREVQAISLTFTQRVGKLLGGTVRSRFGIILNPRPAGAPSPPAAPPEPPRAAAG